jgi:predicted secreted protein
MSAFLFLPFGIKTHDEAGIEKIPGQADSAPANFRPGRIVIRATALSALLTSLFVANYVYGWIVPQDIDFFSPPRDVADRP